MGCVGGAPSLTNSLMIAFFLLWSSFIGFELILASIGVQFKMIRRVFACLAKPRGPQMRLSRWFGGHGNGEPSIQPFARDEKSGYYMNPEEVAVRLIKILTLHDKVQHTDNVTLRKTFANLGIDDLTKVEIFLELEKEFDLEFADEDVERFKNLHDVVEHVSRSFFAR